MHFVTIALDSANKLANYNTTKSIRWFRMNCHLFDAR